MASLAGVLHTSKTKKEVTPGKKSSVLMAEPSDTMSDVNQLDSLYTETLDNDSSLSSSRSSCNSSSDSEDEKAQIEDMKRKWKLR